MVVYWNNILFNFFLIGVVFIGWLFILLNKDIFLIGVVWFIVGFFYLFVKFWLLVFFVKRDYLKVMVFEK